MKKLIASLGMSLVVGNFAACADTESIGEGDDNLPGDIDNNPNPQSGDGKSDGFEATKSDPRYISQTLQYRLDQLPKTGKLDNPVWKSRYPQAPAAVAVAWADTYWPSYDLSHNNRWRGADTQSPVELYDKAFNNAPGCATQPSETCGDNAKAAWDAYKACAGPAAKWQLSYQGLSKMFDGLDNDNDGKKDECDSSDDEGPQGWWGTCHAWAPAALLEPEPQFPVTVNGVTFTPGDIKALIQNAYDRTDAIMLGGRCNAKEIDHDVNGSENTDCRDTNAGAFHVVITNMLGINDSALVEDRTANYEVWNQPLIGYNVTKQDDVTAAVANQCVGATGDTWTYNRNAAKLVEVRLTTDYLTESSASERPVGMRYNISHDTYRYILELSSQGKVVGGRWCKESVGNHPDFLWAPLRARGASNPSIDIAKVRELVAKSLTDGNSGGGGGGADVAFEAAPAAAIPDNSTTGAKADVVVAGVTATAGLDVLVDITHTYVGDLTIELLRNGTRVKVLRANRGGAADNINETYKLTPTELGANLNGTYSVKVVDNARLDVGTINRVKLTFR